MAKPSPPCARLSSERRTAQDQPGERIPRSNPLGSAVRRLRQNAEFKPSRWTVVSGAARPGASNDLRLEHGDSRSHDDERTGGLLQLRVRYSETDQMGVLQLSRAGMVRVRSNRAYAPTAGHVLRRAGAKGVFLPLVEAHLEFKGGAPTTFVADRISSDVIGRARLRFDVQITQNETGAPVVNGWTIHAFMDRQGNPFARRRGSWSCWKSRRRRDSCPCSKVQQFLRR